MGAQNIVKEIKQYQKKWLQHVQRMDTNRLPKQALQYKPKGRRNAGRPRKRWRDQLHLEDQGTGNTPKPSWTWWWWWWFMTQCRFVSKYGVSDECVARFWGQHCPSIQSEVKWFDTFLEGNLHTKIWRKFHIYICPQCCRGRATMFKWLESFKFSSVGKLKICNVFRPNWWWRDTSERTDARQTLPNHLATIEKVRQSVTGSIHACIRSNGGHL